MTSISIFVSALLVNQSWLNAVYRIVLLASRPNTILKTFKSGKAVKV
jgi:hypothetical protein